MLYICSCDNYVEIHYTTVGEQVHKRLLRTTLNNLEEQLNASDLVRCHRSYIVNLGKVCEVEGNSKAMVLLLQQVPQPIPVSRTRIKTIQLLQGR